MRSLGKIMRGSLADTLERHPYNGAETVLEIRTEHCCCGWSGPEHVYHQAEMIGDLIDTWGDE